MNYSTDNSVEIIGAVDPQRAIGRAVIERVLSGAAQSLAHGRAFTGRPATLLYSDGEYVAKCRTELNFGVTDSRRWIERRLARERALAIYHPARTWFIRHTDSATLIANITPHMPPIHRLDDLPEVRLPALIRLFECYLATAARHNCRLDEGLSNFAWTGEALYYLDDDLYSWDRFTGFSQAMGIWFRTFEQWRDQDLAALAAALRQAVQRHFPDNHWIPAIGRLLRQPHCPDPAQRHRQQLFIRGFEQLPAERRIRRIDGSCLALLADVHANLPALEAVLAELRAQGVTQGIVLGDIVGYGPHPGACIDRLRELGWLVIRGNHDHALGSGRWDVGFSSTARWALEWSIDKLDAEQRRWLANLPLYHRQANWLAVHGAPRDPEFFRAYVYRMTYTDNLDYLAQQGVTACFHGHSHVQGTYYRRPDGEDGFTTETLVNMSDYQHVLVCPGSVGQPRSQQPGAEFAVLETNSGRIRFHRIDYPRACTLTDMEQADFPPALRHRLETGY